MVKLRLSRWGDFPGLLRWDNVITRVLMRVETGGSESEKEIWCKQSQKGVGNCFWLCRWRKGLWAKACGHPLQSGKGMDIGCLLEPPEGMQPCWHLNYRTSALQDYRILCVLNYYSRHRELIQVSTLKFQVKESCCVVRLAFASLGMSCGAQWCCCLLPGRENSVYESWRSGLGRTRISQA